MMIPRPDLLTPDSPAGLEVFQLTDDPAVNASHVYMESQIFTPDSKRFVLHQSCHSHGSDPLDPNHRYLLCDLENGGALSPLTDETGATAPAVSPDGAYLYYFIHPHADQNGALTLKRVLLDGTERETLIVVDDFFPGTKFRPRSVYPLSTISSDGERIAVSGFLGDGTMDPGPFGLMIFDVKKASVKLILSGPTWQNMHPQYCRAPGSHDLLIQENHNYISGPDGAMRSRPDGKGIDIHVIRDDGTDFRTMPWGRDGNEFCQGHQCWIGRSTRAITSTHTHEPPTGRLIEGIAMPDAGHLGMLTPWAQRNDLVRDFPEPYFYHFATDIAGKKLITDSAPLDNGARLYVADLGADGEPLQNWKFLLIPQVSKYQPSPKGCHVHPFLSPDGRTGFFNSDVTGKSQAYMVRGF